MYKVILLFMFCFTSIFAQDRLSITQKIIVNQAILGDDLQFALVFETQKKVEYDFSKIQFDGEVIENKKNVSQTGFTSIVNGQIIQSNESYKNVIYFQFTPNKVGSFNLPEMPFTIDGVEYMTKPMSFKVTDTPVDSNIIYVVQLLDGKSDFYPSEVFTIRLFIGLKKYLELDTQSLIFSNFNLFGNSNVELIADSEPNRIVYFNGLPCKIKLMEFQRVGMFKDCNKVYCFDMKYKVLNSGTIPIPKSILKTTVQTDETTIRSSFLGRQQRIPVTKIVYARSNTISINGLELPTIDIPESYNGAIGKFEFEVICSSDTGVKVGDPVTLIVNIKGKGNWEKVQAPPLYKYPQITDYFRASENQPPGLLNESQTEKVFNVKLRVKSKLVKEIPSFEFSYFDVDLKKYQILRSDAIPIKVFENSKEVEIVDFSEPEKQPVSVNPNENEKKLEEEKPFDVHPEKIEIRDILKGNYNSNDGYSYLLFYLSFVPFMILIFLGIYKFYNQREITPEQQIIFKEKNAYPLLQEKLKQVSFEPGSNPYREIGNCLEEFFRNKFPSIVAIVDDEYIHHLFEKNLISKDQEKRIVELYELIENKRYANKSFDKSEIKMFLESLEEELKNV